ncbi:MAG: two-component system sensor histidine kinase NtrB [Alphaproteobacteria bacterium]
MDYSLFDLIDMTVIVLDEKQNVISANHKSYMFFGEDTKGLNIQELTTDETFLKAINDVKNTGNPVSLSAFKLNINKIGSVEINSYISTINGKVIISIINLKELSNGNNISNDLLSMLAHEIKNPLAGIRGASQLIASDNDNEMASLIINETDRITKLVNELENMSQLNNINFNAVNIHSVLDGICTLVNAEGKINIAKDYDPSLPNVWADNDKLVQIFLNIIKNAYEAPNVKNITIRTKYVSGLNIIIDNQKHNAMGVEIINDGDEIDNEMQKKIFNPHQSTKKGGKGLGLAIVSMLVDAHFGKITIDTNENETKFSTILPLERS